MKFINGAFCPSVRPSVGPSVRLSLRKFLTEQEDTQNRTRNVFQRRAIEVTQQNKTRYAQDGDVVELARAVILKALGEKRGHSPFPPPPKKARK